MKKKKGLEFSIPPGQGGGQCCLLSRPFLKFVDWSNSSRNAKNWIYIKIKYTNMISFLGL